MTSKWINLALFASGTFALLGCNPQAGPGPGPDDEILEITSIAPAKGSASGGTSVVIKGEFFPQNPKVTIGGTDCVQAQRISENEIRCKTTRHDIGTVDVTVGPATGAAATLTDAFTFECQVKPLGLQAWANDGGDKVTRDDLRTTCDPNAVRNSVWDGTKVKLFAAKNEVVSFNLLLEASGEAANNVTVSFDTLNGPGTNITSTATDGDGVFNWNDRNIELFFVRYLQIKGLSLTAYSSYDERHVPARFRRNNFGGDGVASGKWKDRPDHDKFYPEIAVPLELEPTFNIPTESSQSIWADIYVPKTANAGVYTGTITVTASGNTTKQIPVELTVRGFTLPDAPSSKTMVVLGYPEIAERYTGQSYPLEGSSQATITRRVRDRHFMIAHRHKISLVDANSGPGDWDSDQPRPEWLARLKGTGGLFTAANGYAGPGRDTGNGIYAIGTYGTWSWANGGESDMRTHTDAWENWFTANSPSTERFLFLKDGVQSCSEVSSYADWLNNNPGPGKNIKSLVTGPFLDLTNDCPAVDVAIDQIPFGNTSKYDTAISNLRGRTGKNLMVAHGMRPGAGSFATEDDGVALRELPWGQYKKNVDRWFYFQSTYYKNEDQGYTPTDVFTNANTFGATPHTDDAFGEYDAYRHSNGHGVLFYPGTDTTFPANNYGVEGPIVSLRLKHWRRGIQDVDYIALANAVNSTKTKAIVDSMIPKVLWEITPENPEDPHPSTARGDISWSTSPDDWEAARAKLADIIEGK